MKELFYKTQLRYKNRLKFIDLVTEIYNTYPTFKPSNWQENVHTSITYDGYKTIDEYTKKSNIPDDLVECISFQVKEFIKLVKIQSVGNFYISEIWYNAYKNRQYQHMHKHSNGYNNVFSGVYYLKYNKLEHTSTRFFHPGFEINFEKVLNNNYFVYVPDVSEEDLIIFPSDIGHDVPMQDTDSLRITVSFNVKCDYYETNIYS